MGFPRERVGRAPHRPTQASRGWTSRACCAGCCKEAAGRAEGVRAGHVARWAPWTSRASHASRPRWALPRASQAGEPREQAAKPGGAALHTRSARAGADREREGTAWDAGIVLDSTAELRPPWPSQGQASCAAAPEPRARPGPCCADVRRKGGAEGGRGSGAATAPEGRAAMAASPSATTPGRGSAASGCRGSRGRGRRDEGGGRKKGGPGLTTVGAKVTWTGGVGGESGHRGELEERGAQGKEECASWEKIRGERKGVWGEADEWAPPGGRRRLATA
jgi:hypothetical protein